jgi:DivIVA domain-containing protein
VSLEPTRHPSAGERAPKPKRTRPLQGESLIAEIRGGTFPTVLRGYDREAVDAYVDYVAGLVSEAEGNRAPETAVRRALDRVGEETAGILQRAHETADDITTRSRQQADERVSQAERDAEAIRSAAEARARQLEEDTRALLAKRRRLIEEIRMVAEELGGVADTAEGRFPDSEVGLPEKEPPPAPRAAGAGAAAAGGRSADEDALSPDTGGPVGEEAAAGTAVPAGAEARYEPPGAEGIEEEHEEPLAVDPLDEEPLEDEEAAGGERGEDDTMGDDPSALESQGPDATVEFPAADPRFGRTDEWPQRPGA